ncbi:MAG: hypothetical protein PVH19_10635 [Planctomycetia bacterium]
MKRFAIVLAVVLALGLSSATMAKGHKGHGKHHGKPHMSKHHGHHGHHGHPGHFSHHRRPPRPPVVVYRRPPVVRVYATPPAYYPPYGYYYGYRSPEAEMAVGIGRIVGAAIEMGR